MGIPLASGVPALAGSLNEAKSSLACFRRRIELQRFLEMCLALVVQLHLMLHLGDLEVGIGLSFDFGKNHKTLVELTGVGKTIAVKMDVGMVFGIEIDGPVQIVEPRCPFMVAGLATAQFEPGGCGFGMALHGLLQGGHGVIVVIHGHVEPAQSGKGGQVVRIGGQGLLISLAGLLATTWRLPCGQSRSADDSAAKFPKATQVAGCGCRLGSSLFLRAATVAWSDGALWGKIVQPSEPVNKQSPSAHVQRPSMVYLALPDQPALERLPAFAAANTNCF